MSSMSGDMIPPVQAAPPQSPPRQSSILISRSTGASYERPERARTSHACEPCRERKTKCDGERPSCRRCLHTGTNCHYGYGKGWRKRKTAEDLTVTQRRLARYEALLNDIMPHVPPNVKAMIEDAQEQENALSTSGGSEANEDGNLPRSMPGLGSEMSTPNSGPRGSLPYPGAPSLSTSSSYPLPPTMATYPPPPLRPFDSLSPVPVNASMPPRTSPQHRASPEASNPIRLPSITSSGQLIEPSLAAQGSSLSTQSPEPLVHAGREQSSSSTKSPFSTDISQQRSAPG